MTPDRQAPRAGGFFFALAILAGTLVGAFSGQTSIGVLAGAGVGTLLLILVWLRDRRRGPGAGRLPDRADPR